MDNKLLHRIKQTQDGLDFIDLLKTLSLNNYESFKKDNSTSNDIYKGYAIAIDSLIKAFESATDKEANKDVLNWTN